ncbi:MAG: hypothetical protein A2X12_05020, partial [Bacteroidetes bacterium GWE2_29_8]
MHNIKTSNLIYLVIFSFIFILNNVYSQTQAKENLGIINGKIIDVSNNQAVEFANVVLLKEDSSLVTGVMSTQDGSFAFNNVNNGKYIVKIIFIGYTTKFVNNISINNSKRKINLGIINFQPSVLNLKEVVVTGEKDLVINKIDRKVINVDNDLKNSGGTVTDILQNIPSISAEQDGTIKLRGNKNVIVLIDGKPTGMSSADGADIIGQLPASTIDRIEIITNPSAKFDPDGTSGMINIIMKKDENKGLNGSINLNVGTNDKYNLSLSLNKNYKRTNYYLSFDNRFNNRNSNESINSIPNDNILNQSIYQTSNSYNNGGMYNINTGIDFRINKNDILGINIKIRDFQRNQTEKFNYKYMLSDSILRYMKRTSDEYRHFQSNQYLLSYKKVFKKDEKEILTEASLSDNHHKRNQDIEQLNFNNNNEFENESNQRTRIDNKNKAIFLQSNFFNKINDDAQFELGFKTSLSNMDMSNNMYTADELLNNWVHSMSYSYTYQENINSIYSTYSNKLLSFSYQAGLRLESFDSKAEFIDSKEKININYYNYYPSLHISKELNSKYEYLLSYSKRVNRPGPRQMNPYIDYSDSANIMQGNPNLKPEYINSIETGIIRRLKEGSLMLNLFYKQSDNVISRVIYKNENGINYLTYQNIAKNINYGTELSFSKNFSKIFKLSSSISYYKNIFEEPDISNLPVNLNENSWSYRLSPTINLKKIVSLNISFIYNSPTVSGQSKYNESYYCDISLKRNIIKNKLDITLRATDIFNTKKDHYITNATSYQITTDKKHESQVVYLGISYKFNNFKEKQTKPTLEREQDYD